MHADVACPHDLTELIDQKGEWPKGSGGLLCAHCQRVILALEFSTEPRHHALLDALLDAMRKAAAMLAK